MYNLEELIEHVEACGGRLVENESAGRISTEEIILGEMALPIDMGEIDPDLEGLWGVHVGDPDAWLGILAADGYLDSSPGNTVFAYKIHVIDPEEDSISVFAIDDPHIADRSDTPFSEIWFSTAKSLPTSMFELEKIYSQEEVEDARQEVENFRGGDFENYENEFKKNPDIDLQNLWRRWLTTGDVYDLIRWQIQQKRHNQPQYHWRGESLCLNCNQSSEWDLSGRFNS
jgi:hypothetical protein